MKRYLCCCGLSLFVCVVFCMGIMSYFHYMDHVDMTVDELKVKHEAVLPFIDVLQNVEIDFDLDINVLMIECRPFDAQEVVSILKNEGWGLDSEEDGVYTLSKAGDRMMVDGQGLISIQY